MCLIQHIQTKLNFTRWSPLLFNHVLSVAMKPENEKLARGWRSSSFPLSTMRSTARWKRSSVAPPQTLVNTVAASSHLFTRCDLSTAPQSYAACWSVRWTSVRSWGFQRLQFSESCAPREHLKDVPGMDRSQHTFPTNSYISVCVCVRTTCISTHRNKHMNCSCKCRFCGWKSIKK